MHQMLPTLVKPHSRYRDSFLATLKETQIDDPNWVKMLLRQVDPADVKKDFAAYCQLLNSYADGQNLPPGYVADTILWLTEGDQFIGQASIRHRLTEYLRSYGGHIGYFIRPSMRRRGYGNLILALAIEEAKKLGINPILVTCDASNLASKKVIENNGGVFENALPQESLPDKLRYWFYY
jgi:predicted acetyltransferase